MLCKFNSGVRSQILDFFTMYCYDLSCVLFKSSTHCFCFHSARLSEKRNFTVHESHYTETNAVCFYCPPQLRLKKLPVIPTLSLQLQRQPQTALRPNPKRTMLSKVPLQPQSQLWRRKLMTRAPSPTRRPWNR